MAEAFQFDWTTAVPVDDEPQPSAPSTPTPPESVDAVMSATPFGAQNMPRPQQGPVDAYEEFDWKTAEPLDGGFDPSTAREATPAEDAEFYEQINNTAYLPTKDEWRWRENFRKQRDDKVSRFIEGGKAMAGGLIQAAAATAFAPFDFLRRGTVAYDEWVHSSAEGVRQTGIATAELWSWAGDAISDRGKEIERNAALDAKLRQQLASENKFTGNAETDGQVFLQAREAARASGFYDKTPEELAEDEDTQYQRFIRDRSFQQQAENITETNIGTLQDGRAEMGIDESKINPGLVTTTQLIADPLNIAAGGLGVFSKVRPLRRAAALAGKPLELGGKAAGAAAQKADELYAGIVEGIEGATGLTGAQQMSALQNPITWKAAAAMGTLKGAGGILRTGQTWMDTGSIFVREAGTGGVGVARVEAAGKLRTAPIPERYRRAYDGFFTSADSTLRRVSETPGLSPIARRSAATFDRVGATQAFRVADDAIGGALATTPVAVPLAAISPEERQPEMLGGLMTVGAVGGVVGGKVRRVAESDDALVAKMLADVEISGGDATSMANMLSHDKLLRMAQMQTVMSAKADFVPLRAKDYELNPTVTEHMGKNSRGFYVDATKGQRPRVFVNLDKLATGDVVGHEIGHAILKSDILGGKIKQGMRSVVDAQYGADGIAALGREYVKAQLTQEVNHKATGIEIEVLTPEESQRKAAGASMDELVADRWKNDPTWREQQINERVDLLNQEALGKGELSFDWARDEIVAETFSGLGKGINVAGLRASGPMGRTLGAMQTAMETMGARFTGNGRLESPNRLFTENPLFDTPQMRKAVNNYVKLYDRYLVGLEKEGKVKQRGRPIAPTGRPEEAARSPHTRTYDNNGVLESELFIERPDGTRVPKSQQMIDTQERARAATLKSINNRTRFVDENSSEWGARRLSNGRVEVGGPNLPPQFDYFVQVPQWLRSKAREFEAGRAEGRSYLYSYNAIGTGEAGSYKIKNLGNVEAKTGEMVPFGWSVSTKNHLLAKVIDLNSFRAAAMRAIDKGQLGEFGNNLRTVEADLKQLMRNYEEGRPGETGLGVTKKNILNGLLGTGTPTNRASNPVWHTLNNQGSIRTFRFDRLNYADQFDTGYFPHYQKININALPDDAGRMSLDDWMRFDADRQTAWLNNRARERGYTNSTNWANSDEAGFAAASDEYRKLFPRPDNNNRMPSALPQAGMAMPEGSVVRGQAMPDAGDAPQPRRYVSMEKFIEEAGDDLSEVLPNAYKNLEFNDDDYPTHLVSFSDARNSMYRSRVPSKEFFDWLHSDRVMDGLVFDKEYTPARPGEGAGHTKESYQALIDRLRKISLKPSKQPATARTRGQAMPDSISQFDDQLEAINRAERQEYIALRKSGKDTKRARDAIRVRYDAMRSPINAQKNAAYRREVLPAINNDVQQVVALSSRAMDNGFSPDLSGVNQPVATRAILGLLQSGKLATAPKVRVRGSDVTVYTPQGYASLADGMVVDGAAMAKMPDRPILASVIKTDSGVIAFATGAELAKGVGKSLEFGIYSAAGKPRDFVTQIRGNEAVRFGEGMDFMSSPNDLFVIDGNIRPIEKVDWAPTQPATGRARGQAMPDVGAPPFYLKSSQAIDAKVQGKAATPDQIKAILTNPQNGIKAEELKWTGVMQEVERLAKENNGKVPKEALLRYLAEDGAVRLEEVRMGGVKKQWTQADIDQLEREAQRTRDFSAYERAVLEYEDQQLGSDANNTGNQTRYGQYQLPGGENYREVVLAMPADMSASQAKVDALTAQMQELMVGADDLFRRAQKDSAARKEYDDKQYRYVQLMKERDRLVFAAQSGETGEIYRSAHFDTPNYIAHMRLNERVDAKGKPGLFIEELQSDRHQQGREKGYRADQATRLKKLTSDEIEEMMALDRLGQNRTPEQRLRFIELANRDSATTFGDGFLGIPDAPFRTSWPLQLFKRALRDAVADGKDWIGWTTGETQAARYDLSKQVKAIDVIDHHSGQGRFIDVRGLDGESVLSMRYNDKGIAEDGKPISDYIGKELAEKVMQLPQGQRDGNSFLVKRFDGVDLKVGGEGMKGFYDTMVPKEVAKYVKQWGGQVEKDRIGKPKQGTGRMTRDEVAEARKDARQLIRGDISVEEFNDAHGTRFTDDDVPGNDPYQLSVGVQTILDAMREQRKQEAGGSFMAWRVNITPQMREGIKKAGQALFVGGAAAVVAEDQLQQ